MASILPNLQPLPVRAEYANHTPALHSVAKIAGTALTALAILATFVFLPLKGALPVSMTIFIVLALLTCGRSNGTSWRPIFWQGATGHSSTLVPRNVQPVAQPGPRVNVGGGHQMRPHLQPGPYHPANGPRVGVGHGHEQPLPQPPIHGQQRVTVGHGHK